jgi:NADH-quinone oxidoreductase subunit F
MSKLINLLTKDISGDSLSVTEYEKAGGFAALKKAAKSSPEDIISEIKKAKLLGRGGAAYPAGSKWEHLLHIP